MSTLIEDDGVWKEPTMMYVKDQDIWKDIGGGGTSDYKIGEFWAIFQNIAPARQLNNAVCKNGICVFVCNEGRLVSGSFPNMSTRTSSFGTSNINDVDYGNGRWVAVGDDGKISSSNNGDTWTQASGTRTGILRAVKYASGIWIVIAEGSRGIYTSVDGISWTNINNANTQYLYDVDYGNGRWVAVGLSGRIVTSVDGITWGAVSSPISYTIHNLKYANGRWIASGSESEIITSEDGLSWQVISVPMKLSSFSRINYVKDTWIIIDPLSREMLKSYDGISWSNEISVINIPRAFDSDEFGNLVGGTNTELLVNLKSTSW